VSIQRYRLQRLLRRGGMGILYEAWDTKLERPVALKVVAHPLDPDACRRALLEAKAITRVRSDHVVQVFDAGEADQLGCPYLVMELLTGEDLQAVIRRGPVASRTAVDWTLQACEALAHLKLHGLVHRDIKPGNLFLESRVDGSVRLKLLDFGVAKDMRHDSSLTHPTSAGDVIGSLPYMAPEQVLDSRDVDVRTDVWGVGAVLYELLAGAPAFVARTRLDAMTQITREAHVPLHRLAPEVPEGLSDVVDRCLAKRREDRWASIADLARALEPFASAGGAALVARVCAIQATELPPFEAPPTGLFSEPPAVDASISGLEALEGVLIGPDTGVDVVAGRVRAGFVTTVPARVAAPASPIRRRFGLTLRAVRTSGFFGPLAVAGVITVVALWPNLVSMAKRRSERLATSASHCVGSFSDYSVLSMSHQVGNPRGEYWNLYTNGWVAQQHQFVTGDAEVRVAAAADLAGDELPHMIVRVDDAVIGEADVASEDFTTFAFPYRATAGFHSVRVQFSNDYLGGGKDRNLILGDVTIGQCASGVL
jgi:eukaryotic-like serine/threonine-protein kinase